MFIRDGMITKETSVKYILSDGREFLDEDEARLHDAKLELETLVERVGYNGMQKSVVVATLVEHSNAFLQLIAKIETARSKLASKGVRRPYEPTRETL